MEFSAISLTPSWSNSISQQLSIGGSVPGKIFKMDNLPIGSAGLSTGTVYRNGNQLMIV